VRLKPGDRVAVIGLSHELQKAIGDLPLEVVRSFDVVQARRWEPVYTPLPERQQDDVTGYYARKRGRR
jgi:hypothetical protein